MQDSQKRNLGRVSLLCLLLGLAPGCRHFKLSDAHEYAPIQSHTLDYQDWTLPMWRGQAPLHLREWIHQPGTRLVWVVYFAPWCPNWRYEAPWVYRLLEQYSPHGLRVVGVSEYGSLEDLETFFTEGLPPYPVAVESESAEARESTSHYYYRRRTSDPRKWGSPWNLFFVPSEGKETEGPVAHQVWVANGELRTEEAEAFLRAKLGLGSE